MKIYKNKHKNIRGNIQLHKNHEIKYVLFKFPAAFIYSNITQTSKVF